MKVHDSFNSAPGEKGPDSEGFLHVEAADCAVVTEPPSLKSRGWMHPSSPFAHLDPGQDPLKADEWQLS